jgi:hypothetical protein
VSPSNRMRRAAHDKVHAPDCVARRGICAQAPRVRRAVADAERRTTFQVEYLHVES